MSYRIYYGTKNFQYEKFKNWKDACTFMKRTLFKGIDIHAVTYEEDDL